jgi:hypothetical protein
MVGAGVLVAAGIVLGGGVLVGSGCGPGPGLGGFGSSGVLVASGVLVPSGGPAAPAVAVGVPLCTSGGIAVAVSMGSKVALGDAVAVGVGVGTPLTTVESWQSYTSALPGPSPTAHTVVVHWPKSRIVADIDTEALAPAARPSASAQSVRSVASSKAPPALALATLNPLDSCAATFSSPRYLAIVWLRPPGSFETTCTSISGTVPRLVTT